MNLIKYFLAIFVFSLSFTIVAPVFALPPDASSTVTNLDATAGKIPAFSSQTKLDARQTVIERVGSIVGFVLSFVGIIFLVLTIYAGIQWMTAMGNSSAVDKAKDLLINAVIGLVIVTAAYSITSFIGNQLVK
jgi:lysylphosphatidylglycerol synthetase-like protein (DUF2156 family)